MYLKQNELQYTYSVIPELNDGQDYDYIEKTILSVLHEQKVSFKQMIEIFDAIEARVKNVLEDNIIDQEIPD